MYSSKSTRLWAWTNFMTWTTPSNQKWVHESVTLNQNTTTASSAENVQVPECQILLTGNYQNISKQRVGMFEPAHMHQNWHPGVCQNGQLCDFKSTGFWWPLRPANCSSQGKPNENFIFAEAKWMNIIMSSSRGNWQHRHLKSAKSPSNQPGNLPQSLHRFFVPFVCPNAPNPIVQSVAKCRSTQPRSIRAAPHMRYGYPFSLHHSPSSIWHKPGQGFNL